MEARGSRPPAIDGQQGEVDDETSNLCWCADEWTPAAIKMLLDGKPQHAFQVQFVRQFKKMRDRRQTRQNSDEQGKP